MWYAIKPFFLDLFLINTKDEKTATFRPKSWTIRFLKMSIVKYANFACIFFNPWFQCLDRLVF